MAGKNDRQFSFDVQLNWLNGKRGILSARDVAGAIQVATPPAFGGEGKCWSPEHLFLSSISSCYMSTFLAFAERLHLKIEKMDCEAIGQIQIIGGRYKFSEINLYPRIVINDEAMRELFNTAIEKTHRYCLITNSVDALVYYHPEILVDKPTSALNEQGAGVANDKIFSETNY